MNGVSWTRVDGRYYARDRFTLERATRRSSRGTAQIVVGWDLTDTWTGAQRRCDTIQDASREVNAIALHEQFIRDAVHPADARIVADPRDPQRPTPHVEVWIRGPHHDRTAVYVGLFARPAAEARHQFAADVRSFLTRIGALDAAKLPEDYPT